MSKYHAIKTEVDGYVFDSKAEARRYGDLRLLEQAGEIHNLQVHPKYELAPAWRDSDGKRIRAINYEADFVYTDSLGYWVVEDVKGVETPVFRLKRNLFLRKYPHLRLVVTK